MLSYTSEYFQVKSIVQKELRQENNVVESSKTQKRTHRVKNKSTYQNSSFIKNLEIEMSSPVDKKRKEKQKQLDEKVMILKETTLKDYLKGNKNMKKKSDRLLDFSKYITHSYRQERNEGIIHQKSCMIPKSPLKKSTKGNTINTTPIKTKKLVNSRFRDNIKKKSNQLSNNGYYQYKKYGINSNMTMKNTKNQDIIEEDFSFKNTKNEHKIYNNYKYLKKNSKFRKKIIQKVTPVKNSGSYSTQLQTQDKNSSFN